MRVNKPTLPCKGCGKEFKQNRVGHQYCTKQCYLDSTKERRLQFNRSIFGRTGYAKDIYQAYDNVDNKLNREYDDELY